MSEFEDAGPADTDREDLAIADAAGAGGADDAVGHFLHALVAHPDADLHLGKKGHAVLAAQVAFEVALLPRVTLGFLNHAGNHIQLADDLEHRFGTERL